VIRKLARLRIPKYSPSFDVHRYQEESTRYERQIEVQMQQLGELKRRVERQAAAEDEPPEAP
jgi:hypothetical protein